MHCCTNISQKCIIGTVLYGQVPELNSSTPCHTVQDCWMCYWPRQDGCTFVLTYPRSVILHCSIWPGPRDVQLQPAVIVQDCWMCYWPRQDECTSVLTSPTSVIAPLYMDRSESWTASTPCRTVQDCWMCSWPRLLQNSKPSDLVLLPSVRQLPPRFVLLYIVVVVFRRFFSLVCACVRACVRACVCVRVWFFHRYGLFFSLSLLVRCCFLFRY